MLKVHTKEKCFFTASSSAQHSCIQALQTSMNIFSQYNRETMCFYYVYTKQIPHLR